MIHKSHPSHATVCVEYLGPDLSHAGAPKIRSYINGSRHAPFPNTLGISLAYWNADRGVPSHISSYLFLDEIEGC